MSTVRPTNYPQRRARSNFYGAALAILPLAAIATFLLYGFLMLPMLGYETDEVMFVYDLSHPRDAVAWFSYFHNHEGPYMLMSYLGALKSWLYAPLFAVVSPSVWSIRTPALLLAALTILLTGWLLRKIHGWIAALIVVCLLATDVVFQITAVFDWGPVVLQNFLLVLGLILLLKWSRDGRNHLLFWAGLVFGLNLWNKALFVWNLSGMVVAFVVVAFPYLIRQWRLKRAAILLLGFCLGAAPLIKFNVKTDGSTFRANSHLSLDGFGVKAAYLRHSLDGQTGPTNLVDANSPAVDEAHSALESFALSLAGGVGKSPSTWRFCLGIALILLALAAAPAIQRRWILFFLISGGVGWFESALTVNAGGSIHHTVLFWIDWYCAVALAAACVTKLRPRFTEPAILILTLILCVRGAWSEDLAYANMIAFSPKTPWTTADRNLNAFLLKLGVHRAVIADWGIGNVVGLRSFDKVAPHEEEFELNSGEFDRATFDGCVHPSCVVVTHTPAQIAFPVAFQTLEESLRSAHLSKIDASIISDTHGLPVFSVFSVGQLAAGVEPYRSNTLQPTTGSITASGYPRSAEFRFWADPGLANLNPDGLVTNIYWSVPGVDRVEIHVTSPSGQLFAAGGSVGVAVTGHWARPGVKFYLQDARHGNVTSANRTLAVLVLR